MSKKETMNSSADRGNFQRQGIIRRAEEGETSIEHAEEMLQLLTNMDQKQAQLEDDPSWRQNNLEYDLRSTQWICEKVKASDKYSQNLYAALCNNDFASNQVWPRLRNQIWSCSWRYAGGIVANMRESGDYIDWYCSGIRAQADDEMFRNMSSAEQEQYLFIQNSFVSESVVTDEIRQDLFKLGWIVVTQENDSV